MTSWSVVLQRTALAGRGSQPIPISRRGSDSPTQRSARMCRAPGEAVTRHTVPRWASQRNLPAMCLGVLDWPKAAAIRTARRDQMRPFRPVGAGAARSIQEAIALIVEPDANPCAISTRSAPGNILRTRNLRHLGHRGYDAITPPSALRRERPGFRSGIPIRRHAGCRIRRCACALKPVGSTSTPAKPQVAHTPNTPPALLLSYSGSRR